MDFFMKHWQAILLISGFVWAAAVNALPPPVIGGSRFYTFFYSFAHGLKLNIGEAYSAGKLGMQPRP